MPIIQFHGKHRQRTEHQVNWKFDGHQKPKEGPGAAEGEGHPLGILGATQGPEKEGPREKRSPEYQGTAQETRHEEGRGEEEQGEGRCGPLPQDHPGGPGPGGPVAGHIGQGGQQEHGPDGQDVRQGFPPSTKGHRPGQGPAEEHVEAAVAKGIGQKVPEGAGFQAKRRHAIGHAQEAGGSPQPQDPGKSGGGP